MTELDQMWSQLLSDAASKAANSGRQDIGEYLQLKVANDLIRSRGIKWLFDTIIEIALNDAAVASRIEVERIEPHYFKRTNSRIVGSCIRIRKGVRCLTIEAGWTRSPGDGIMRGAALAAARISHFGLKGAATDLVLAYNDAFPLWHREDSDGIRDILEIDDLKAHFRLFLDG